MKLYDVLKMKNASVMSVFCVTEYTICNIVSSHLFKF